MFHRSIASAPAALRIGLRRIWRLATGLLVLVLGLVAVLLLWTVERRTLTEALDEVEGKAQEVLVSLTRVPAREASWALWKARRDLERQHRRLQRVAASWGEAEKDPAVQARYRRTERELLRNIRLLEAARDAVQSAGKEQLTEAWTGLVVEILIARTHWPIAGVVRVQPRTLSPREVGRDIVQGMQLAAFWPYHAVRNLFRPGLPFGVLRSMFFPYRDASIFFAGHIVGIGLAGVGVGYGLCWLGMRHNKASLSYAGLLYFVYLIVFSVSMINLHWGILS